MDFGLAITAALCLAGLGVIGGYTFAFAAHCFFVIAETTAAGQDEVSWPDEPLLDRAGKGFILGWLILVSLAPAFVVGSIFARDQPGLLFIATAIGFGLLFPLVVLSAQSASTVFAVIYPPALVRVLKRPDYLIGYYLAMLPALAGGAAGLYVLHALAFWLAPFGAALVGWSMLTIARLYGRLALKVSRVTFRARPDAAPPAPRRPPRKRREHVSDPWAMPSELPDVSKDPDASYGLRAADAPELPAPDRPGLKRLWIEDDDDGQPFGLVGEAEKQQLPEAMLKPSEYEMRLAAGGKPPKAPTWTWIGGTYTFPFRNTSLGRLAWLTTGLTFSGFLWKGIFPAG